MKPRALAFVVGVGGCVLFAAAEETLPARRPSIASEAIKGFKYHPPPAVSIERSPVLKPVTATDAPVVMSPYIVKVQPDRVYVEVKAALEQRERLKPPPALWERGNLQILTLPKVEASRGGEARLSLGIINLNF
jgi:hypothetical protein